MRENSLRRSIAAFALLVLAPIGQAKMPLQPELQVMGGWGSLVVDDQPRNLEWRSGPDLRVQCLMGRTRYLRAYLAADLSSIALGTTSVPDNLGGMRHVSGGDRHGTLVMCGVRFQVPFETQPIVLWLLAGLGSGRTQQDRVTGLDLQQVDVTLFVREFGAGADIRLGEHLWLGLGGLKQISNGLIFAGQHEGHSSRIMGGLGWRF